VVDVHIHLLFHGVLDSVVTGSHGMLVTV
jgi:hypothetical protein